MKTTVSIFIFAVMSAYAQSQTDYQTVHVLFNNHIEGDGTSQPGDPACSSDTTYQTLPLPPIGIINFRPSFAIDIVGTWLLRERTNRVTDSFGGKPKWFQCPVGEFWQTEADPRYGRRLFSSINYLALGDEFGIQGHAIYYSGQRFCWYPSPHTPQGIQWKFRDLHRFAESVYFNRQKINLGKTYTGGHKLESPALGTVRAEQIIDSMAYALGYRIAYEDHDGHLEDDEPPGINNSRPSYFVYEARYPNGVKIVKIDMNGSLNDGCSGNTPRCETSTEAIRRFENTVAARFADPDTSRVYYFAVVNHANAYFAGKHAEVSGFPPRPSEYSALNKFLDTLRQRVQTGVRIKFVTPLELASIFYTLGGITSVGEDGLSSTPKNFVLYQNYPNPFNPSTTIRFSIPQRATVTLKNFDVLGREVVTLVDEIKEAGIHNSTFNTLNYTLQSGVYFYQLRAGKFVETKKMILLK